MHLQQGEQLYVIRLTNDRTRKNDHLNLGAGEWAVWLHGNEQVDGAVAQRITTNICAFTVERSGVLEGDAMPELPAGLGEQLDARVAVLEQQRGALPAVGESDEGNTSDYWSIVCDINSQTMTLGTNATPLFTDMSYSWVAYARK
jgi:hypothetical protein